MRTSAKIVLAGTCITCVAASSAAVTVSSPAAPVVAVSQADQLIAPGPHLADALAARAVRAQPLSEHFTVKDWRNVKPAAKFGKELAARRHTMDALKLEKAIRAVQLRPLPLHASQEAFLARKAEQAATLRALELAAEQRVEAKWAGRVAARKYLPDLKVAAAARYAKMTAKAESDAAAGIDEVEATKATKGPNKRERQAAKKAAQKALADKTDKTEDKTTTTGTTDKKDKKGKQTSANKTGDLSLADDSEVADSTEVRSSSAEAVAAAGAADAHSSASSSANEAAGAPGARKPVVAQGNFGSRTSVSLALVTALFAVASSLL
jgi:hypothetical protein